MIRKLRLYIAASLAVGLTLRARLLLFWRMTKNLRVRLGLASYHPTQVFSLPTVYGVLHFRDNFGDITNVPGILHEQIYAPPVVMGDGAMLDVGANIGLAAAWFSRSYPGCEVHCFEPLSENAALIPLNCPGALVHNVAVGAAPGTIELSVDVDAVMASRIRYGRPSETRELHVVSLDELVLARRIERVALLKIDTEGMELDVLIGAPHTLARTRIVALETHERHRHDGVLRILREHGFRIDREEFHGATGLVFASRGEETAPALATPKHASTRTRIAEIG